MRPKGRFIIIVCAASLLLAVVCLLWDGLRWSQDSAPVAREFQTTVCGLGLGATVIPKGCFISFDPRLEKYCSAALYPLPGEAAWCPDHTASALTFGHASSEKMRQQP